MYSLSYLNENHDKIYSMFVSVLYIIIERQ